MTARAEAIRISGKSDIEVPRLLPVGGGLQFSSSPFDLPHPLPLNLPLHRPITFSSGASVSRAAASARGAAFQSWSEKPSAIPSVLYELRCRIVLPAGRTAD